MEGLIKQFDLLLNGEHTVQVKYGSEIKFQFNIETTQGIEKPVKISIDHVSEAQNVQIAELEIELKEAKKYTFSTQVKFEQQYKDVLEALESEILLIKVIANDEEVLRQAYFIDKEDTENQLYIAEDDFADDLFYGEEMEEFEEFEEVPEEMYEEMYEEIPEELAEAIEENRKHNIELSQMPFTKAIGERLMLTIGKFQCCCCCEECCKQ